MELYPYTFRTPRNGHTITVEAHLVDAFISIFTRTSNTEKYLKGRLDKMLDVYYALIDNGLLFNEDYLFKMKLSVPKIYMSLKTGMEEEHMGVKGFEYPISPALKELLIGMSDLEFIKWHYREMESGMLSYQYGATESKIRAISNIRRLSDKALEQATTIKELKVIETKVEKVVSIKKVPVAIRRNEYDWEHDFMDRVLIKRYDELLNSTLYSPMLGELLNLFSVTLVYQEYITFMKTSFPRSLPLGKNTFKGWVIDVCCIQGNHPKQQVQTHNTVVKGLGVAKVRDFYHFKSQENLKVVLTVLK